MSGTTEARQLVKCVQIFFAAKRAGLTPIAGEAVHALAYLSEALAPVWGLSNTGDVLKRDGLPFLPTVQHAIDRLVLIGLLEVTSLTHVRSGTTGSTTATFTPREVAFGPVVTVLQSFPDEVEYQNFVLEIAFGLARSTDVRALFLADASYSDPATGLRRLIDLTAENRPNASARVAELFDGYTDRPSFMTPAQKVALYINLLDRKAHHD